MGRSAGDPKKGPDKKRPTGKEIMKRRTPDDLSLRPARFESDPKTAADHSTAGQAALPLRLYLEFRASYN
jgi:hypothetical protein